MSEAKTSNSLNQIVPSSKVIYEDKIYDVGQVKGKMIDLYKEGLFIVQINASNVEVL